MKKLDPGNFYDGWKIRKVLGRLREKLVVQDDKGETKLWRIVECIPEEGNTKRMPLFSQKRQ